MDVDAKKPPSSGSIDEVHGGGARAHSVSLSSHPDSGTAPAAPQPPAGKLSPPQTSASKSDIRKSVAASPSMNQLQRGQSSAVDLAGSTTVIIQKTPVGSYKKTVLSAQERLPKTCCQRFLKVVVALMTDMSLLVVVGLFTVIGGFLFKHLECVEKHVLVLPYNISKRRMQLVLRIFGLTETPEYYSLAQAKQWRNKTMELLEGFEEEVGEVSIAISEQRSDPWTMSSAILYSVTLITTIGYGNIAPKTVMGKLATIVYSLIGIPITLLYLANIGGTMANIFKWFYEVTMKLLHGRKVKAERSEVGGGVRVPVTVTCIVILGYIVLGAMIFSIWEQKWSIIDSAYFCFITLSTIGLGDYVFGFDENAQNNSKQLVSALYLIFGLSLLSMGFNLLQDEIINKYLQLMDKMGMRGSKKRNRPASNP